MGYRTLRDDYTARAAAVIRVIDQQHAEDDPQPKPPRRWGRVLVTICAVGLFAVLVGGLVARESRSRGNATTATGDIRLTTGQLLSDAQAAAAGGDFTKAIDLYSQVLDAQPTNAEGLTYRAWSTVQAGKDEAAAWKDLDAAIGFDPKYPDARVFRAVLFVQDKKYDEAAKELATFDALNPPQLMKDVVAQQHLREQIVAGQVSAKLLVDNPPTLAASGFSADDVRTAAEEIAEQARLSDALKLFDMAIAVNPRDARAHAYKGWALARAGVQAKQQQLIDVALTEFGAALRVDPAYPDALVFRAFTWIYGGGKAADAKADLAAFDALPNKPADLTSLIDQYGLRGAIDDKLKQPNG